MPSGFRAELIGGVVFVPSPLKADHGHHHGRIMTWLGLYRARTPGVDLLDNATDILSTDSEPQPDAFLTLANGQTGITTDGYVKGPPEFIAEVASSSASYDLHSKKRDYERHGVGEYLVVLVREPHVVWFVREGGAQSAFRELSAGSDGILRSPTLPGLWLDPQALLRDDMNRVLDVLMAGLSSPQHASFIARARP